MYLNDKRRVVEQVNKTWVKVIAVIAYVISVSLVALVLGFYYWVFWEPKYDADNVTTSKTMDLNDYYSRSIQLGTINVSKYSGANENVNFYSFLFSV